ncbi:hypothetical protein IMSHALPRED_009175 [Imshaugia aleurites]|uniref:DUF6987 domain-containing protein n=1 Tax=Imshaugia aleurites TaxID=172621 RepID=A0A8H3EQP2_9LECA|nr:hypothetical protein IMSHALPRED_009175 [Imshaugia aleurites]
MAPSPAAGKTPVKQTPKTPTTPTKSGKNPAPKLGKPQGANTDPKSPALPDRPKPGQAAKGAASKLGTPKAQKPVEDTKKDVEDKTEDTKKGVEDTTEDKGIDLKDNEPADDADNEETDTPIGKVSQAGNETGEEASSAVSTADDDAEDAVGGAKEAAEDTAEDTDVPDTDQATDTADEATGGVTGAAGGLADKAKEGADGATEKAQDTADDVEDKAGETAEGAEEKVGETAEGAEEKVGETAEGAEETAEGAEETAGETAEGAEGAVDEAGEGVEAPEVDGVEDAAEGLADELPVDLSVLKGLEVGEGGEIFGADGEVIGNIEEGDPEDLVGKTIGDDGEILDEDGDVIGRATVLPDKAQELADKAKGDLPDIKVLDGLEVGEGGEILGPDGTPLGKITEGNPEDLVGMTLNENGEIVDEDGDVIGRAEVVPGDAADKLNEAGEEAGEEVGEEIPEDAADVDHAAKIAEIASGLTPDLSILQGKKINKKGKILDEEGEIIGQLTEDSDPKKCAGKIPNEDGEILDADGEVVGKVEVVPGEAADAAMKELHPELVEKLEEAEQAAEEAAQEAEVPQLPGLDILEGLKVNKKGEVLNEDGEPIARVSEGEITELAGKKINANGEVLDAEGNVIGKVELIPEAFPEVPAEGDEEGEEALEEAPEEAPQLPGMDILEGLKVNKKGEVVNEDGDAIAKLVEGDLEACKGKKINAEGEVIDADGNVIGKVELIPEAFPDAVQPEEAGPDFSVLEGYKVNKNGDVVNEDGETLAKLVEGDLEACKGKKINPQGEVLDAEGNVIGKVELAGAPEEEEETGPELPPLSTMAGMKCNKAGKIVNDDGDIVGELVEGDAKKLSKMKAELDDEGQFWDGKGKVIGRAVTLPIEEHEEESPFAGLEGLVVVADGWVEDENQNKVGILTEGDPKKMVGRAVDEDGDVIDTRGNVVGHAERYEEPEAEEEVKADLSILKGLEVNKQGNVIGPEGVPIARLVEGNAKELAGKKCDEEGQLWNDSGKVIGRCELIPENEREAKPEGPFAGLEGCVVVKDAYVEDEDGNRVGVVVEGDAKRLVGRAVDEDGDIIDKYGKVIGHAEPYDEPEEEVADLSSLEGKVVNKAGNVVDEHGTIFGRIAEGNPEELAGKKVDGQGQIWNDNGKVIGQAELLPGGGTQAPEGAFAGFENLVVADGGMVTDAAGQIVGKLDEESMPNAEKLLGRKVDEDGEILDKAGNSIGKAIRWKPEEKERRINPMSGHVVNSKGEVRDENGELLGMVTDGHLPTLVGCEVDDNGYVIDNDGNKIGECTLMENLPEDEEVGPTEEELQKAEDAEIAKKMNNIVQQTIEKMQPVCKNITDRMDKADRTPKEELDEEELVKDVKPMIEEGNRILQECNGAIRGLDPDGHIAATAKARAAAGEATPQENALANSLKELTSTIVQTIENAKKKLNDMPHAKKELNPLWGLLTEPLFQIIAAVGLLLSGVLGLVGKLLNGLGLGGIVNGLLGGLGIDKLLGGLGLGSIGKSLGLGGGKKK